MNSDKRKTSGNAMIYVLLALALLAALTMVLSKGGSEQEGYLDADKVELLVTKSIAYAATAKNTVDQMMMSGTTLANLNFDRPVDATYDTAPYIHKVFHPQGGGLTLESADPMLFPGTTTPPSGWYMGRFNNVEWTPTTANDVMFVGYGISQAACAGINKKIKGDAAIPSAGTGIIKFFVNNTISSVSNASFTKTDCASCEGYPSMCVTDATASVYVYYNIISGQ